MARCTLPLPPPHPRHHLHSPPLAARLESDIAVLEQHLEVMRATYQLNAEKLEYNYRVLLERDAGACARTRTARRCVRACWYCL